MKTRQSTRDDEAADLSSLGEGGSLWAVSGVDVGGDRSRGVVGSVPTVTRSLNSGDEAQGREKRCEGLHVDR